MVTTAYCFNIFHFVLRQYVFYLLNQLKHTPLFMGRVLMLVL